METITVTPSIHIDVHGPLDEDRPLCYLTLDNYPNDQSIPIFSHEVKPLILALTNAAVILANLWQGHQAPEPPAKEEP